MMRPLRVGFMESAYTKRNYSSIPEVEFSLLLNSMHRMDGNSLELKPGR